MRADIILFVFAKDHIFGLPGVICSISKTITSERGRDIDIFGPMGISRYLSFNLQMSRFARNEYMHQKFHELFTGRDLRDVRERPPRNCEFITATPEEDSDGVSWKCFEDERYIVKAGLLKHTIPCFGYVVTEKERPGKFLVEKAIELNVPRGRLWGLLQEGKSVKVGDTVVHSEQVTEAPRKGRKIVVLGDTANSNSLIPFAMDADLLIHECTYTEDMKFVHFHFFKIQFLSLYFSKEARSRGHSSLSMAVEFANSINAKRLALTHFGKRFNTTTIYVRTPFFLDCLQPHRMIFQTDEERTETLKKEAKQHFKGEVMIARDFLEIDLPRYV